MQGKELIILNHGDSNIFIFLSLLFIFTDVHVSCMAETIHIDLLLAVTINGLECFCSLRKDTSLKKRTWNIG